MAEVSAELRERLRSDAAFRSAFFEEVLLQFAVGMNLVDEEGNFMDPNAGLRQSPVDARVAGRPVIHYYGLSKEQIEKMGLSADEMKELGTYMTIDSDPNFIEDPTAGSGALMAHPGASLWTPPPPPADPAMASTQNPTGSLAAETAKTAEATSRDAVIGKDGEIQHLGPFQREEILSAGRAASVQASQETTTDSKADEPKANGPETTDPKAKTPAKA